MKPEEVLDIRNRAKTLIRHQLVISLVEEMTHKFIGRTMGDIRRMVVAAVLLEDSDKPMPVSMEERAEFIERTNTVYRVFAEEVSDTILRLDKRSSDRVKRMLLGTPDPFFLHESRSVQDEEDVPVTIDEAEQDDDGEVH